jgi:hypothetical protein
MHPISQGLAVHAADPCGIGAVHSIEDSRQ